MFRSLAAVATAARLLVVWLGLPETHLISDDAYYYFVTARHIAAGAGPTFDGVAITNGFHPLWMLILVPVFRLFPHDLWLPVRTALSLTVAMDLASGWLLFDLVRHRAGPRPALVAAATWFLLPPTTLLGLQGLEASLGTLAVLVLLRHLDRQEDAPSSGPRSALLTGVWLALAGLARTDNLVSAGSAVVLVAALRPAAAGVRGRGRWMAHVVLAALLVTGPWFVWNYHHFGSLVQVSGQVKLQVRELFGGLPWGWGDPGSAALTLLHMLFAPVLVSSKYLCGEQFDGGRFALPLAMASQILILVLFARLARRRARSGTLRATVFTFPIAWMLLHTLLYGFIWHSYSTWYAHTWFALVIVLLAGTADDPKTRAVRSAGNWLPRASTLTVLLCLIQLAQYPLYLTRIELGARGPEKQFRPPLDRLQAQAPGGLRIGAFDAGALAYVAGTYPGFTVVNLDGLVNNEIYRACREGRYADWVLNHVDVVVQDIRRARLFCGPEDVERLRIRYGQVSP